MRCPHSLASSALVQPTRLACSRCAPRAQRDARPFFSRRGGSQRARRHLPPVVRAQRRIIYYLLPRKHVRQRRRETAGAGIPGFAYSTAEKKKKLRERAKNKQTNQQKHQNTPSKPAKSRKFYPMATHCSGNRANSIYNRIFRAFAHPEVAPRSAQSWCLVLGAWGVRRPRHEI